MSLERRPKSLGTFEKRAPGRDLNADLFDTGEVFNQLSYRTNLVTSTGRTVKAGKIPACLPNPFAVCNGRSCKVISLGVIPDS